MTKLNRVEHKIFASEAPLEEMGQFGSAVETTKLNTKDIATIQALPAYNQGWGSAIVSDKNYPPMEEMNGVLNVMSYHTGYLYQEGIPSWIATQEYSSSSIVKDNSGNKLYKSLQENNKGHALQEGVWWKKMELGVGMPSEKFTDLSLGASGTTYTAPADGWFTCSKRANYNNQFLEIINNQNQNQTSTFPNVEGYMARVFLPVKKGDVVLINYNIGGKLNYFRFIYAEGSK